MVGIDPGFFGDIVLFPSVPFPFFSRHYVVRGPELTPYEGKALPVVFAWKFGNSRGWEEAE